MGKLMTYIGTFFTHFFDTLFNWFARLWDNGSKFLNVYISAGIVIFGWIVWAFGQIGEIVTLILARLATVAGIIAQLDVGKVTGSDYFLLANKFFPVSELFASLVLYGTVVVATFFIRVLIQIYKLIPAKAS